MKIKKILPISISAMVGILISTLPHWINYFFHGSAAYFADSDDTALYLNYAARAYHNHPFLLRDLIDPQAGTFSPWLQIIPAVLIAKIFAISPIYILLIWRIWAGLSIGVTTFLALNLFIKKPWWATLFTAAFLTDSGQITAHVFIRQFVLLTKIIFYHDQSLFATYPIIHPEWRLITPGLSLALLLLHIFFLQQMLDKPNKRNMFFAGISYSVLFYTYFYYWTAISLALAFIWLNQRKQRMAILQSAAIGILLGLPAIAQNFLIKKNSHPDWLPRIDFFLPIPHFSEFLFPRLAIVLLIGLSLYLWKKRMTSYAYLACVAWAALLLMNHQVISGLQIQNFHFGYALGPILSLLTLLLLYKFIERKKDLRQQAIIALMLISILGGFYLRYLEGTRTQESIALFQAYKAYRRGLFFHFHSWTNNAIIAGDNFYINNAIVFDNLRPLAGMPLAFSPTLSNNDWNRRLALNAYLSGMQVDDFYAQQSTQALQYIWGIWGRDENLRKDLFATRMALFLNISEDPLPYLEQYHVQYVVASKQSAIPEIILRLSDQWRTIFDDESWSVWEYLPRAK